MKNNNKNKKHENKKTLIIVAILLIIALIAGGTYAYWTWNSNNIVAVNATISTGTFSLTLDGGTGSNKVALAPTDCHGSSLGNYVDQKTIKVTYQNTTAFPAHAVLKLNLSSFTFENGTPTDTALGHLHYSITTNSASTLCFSDALSTSDANTISITGNSTSTTPATFVGKTSAGSNLITWDYKVPANTTTATTKTYYLYVWIDKDYTYQNVGSGVVSDPLQDMKYNLAWSIQNNQIIQYAG